MSDTTITSANSVVTLTVPGLFPAPVQLSGYSADRAWESDSQELAETQMGVDGRQTAGWTPMPINQTYNFQADSPSKAIFVAIATAMRVTRDVYYINGAISLPSTGEAYIGTRGVLVSYKAIADAGKVLQPVAYTIRWETLTPTLL